MNQLPQQYHPQQYQAQFWQEAIAVVASLATIALIITQVIKAVKEAIRH